MADDWNGWVTRWKHVLHVKWKGGWDGASGSGRAADLNPLSSRFNLTDWSLSFQLLVQRIASSSRVGTIMGVCEWVLIPVILTLPVAVYVDTVRDTCSRSVIFVGMRVQRVELGFCKFLLLHFTQWMGQCSVQRNIMWIKWDFRVR